MCQLKWPSTHPPFIVLRLVYYIPSARAHLIYLSIICVIYILFYHVGLAALGWAKSSRMDRPSKSFPLSFAALSSDASGSLNSMKPQPLKACVSLSESQRIEDTSQSLKNSLILSSSMSKLETRDEVTQFHKQTEYTHKKNQFEDIVN